MLINIHSHFKNSRFKSIQDWKLVATLSFCFQLWSLYFKVVLLLHSQASLCLVDIDNCTVTTPEDLPVFPDEQELIEELSDTVKRFNVQLPQDNEIRPGSGTNSLENSLEIPQDYSFSQTANDSSDYETIIPQKSDDCKQMFFSSSAA